MEKTLENQTIALAGLVQSAELVRQLARTGRCDESALSACMRSLLMVDAEDILDVYGGLQGLDQGLRVIERQFKDPSKIDPQAARYASTLIILEPRFSEQKEMWLSVQRAIKKAQELRNLGKSFLSPEIFELFSEAYQMTVSTLKPRVMVAGDQRILSNPQNAAMIRALLLSGIRAALLFRQAGGSKWRIFFCRSRYRQLAAGMLKSLG